MLLITLSLLLTLCSIPRTGLDHVETKDILENIVIGFHVKKMQMSDRREGACSSTVFISRCVLGFLTCTFDQE